MYNAGATRERTLEETKAKFEADRKALNNLFQNYQQNKTLSPEQELKMNNILTFSSEIKDIDGFLEKCSNRRLFRSFTW